MTKIKFLKKCSIIFLIPLGIHEGLATISGPPPQQEPQAFSNSAASNPNSTSLIPPSQASAPPPSSSASRSYQNIQEARQGQLESTAAAICQAHSSVLSGFSANTHSYSSSNSGLGAGLAHFAGEAPDEERWFTRRSALACFQRYLDLMGRRYQEVLGRTDNLTSPDRNPLMSEAMGLRNLGSTCYANSAHVLLWAMNLRPHVAHPHAAAGAAFPLSQNPQNGSSEDLGLATRAVMEGFENYLRSQRSPLNPQGYLDREHPLLGYQHDSAEYLYRVLDLLESNPNDTNLAGSFRVATRSVLSDGRTNALQEGQDERSRWLLPLFGIQGEPTLQELLDSELAPQFAENIQWDGDPSVRLNGHRHIYILQNGNLPRATLLQVNRFAPDGSKITRRVSVNSVVKFRYHESVDQLQDPPSEHSLRLKAALVHHGQGLNFGHYSTILRHQGQWFQHDDSSVIRIDARTAFEIMSRDGYVFLYDSDALEDAALPSVSHRITVSS